MDKKLCLLCCQGFRREMEAAIAAEGWPDVAVADFPVRCGHPPLTWSELQRPTSVECSEVIILGRSCLHGLANPPEDWPPTRQRQLDECFHLVAGETLVSELIERDAYLMTPAWLDDWRGNLQRLGFNESNAAGFFHDFARELVLLDTGVIADVAGKLAELASVARLPSSRIAVGIDHARLVLARLVMEWRLQNERERARQCERISIKERVDLIAAIDFLGRLALLKDEPETISAIAEIFHMLFAPAEFHYVRFERGAMQHNAMLPAGLERQLAAMAHDWAWTESGTGFLLRISRAGETLGIIIADHFAFPDFRDRYLNLALSVSSVCGLAIENARTYRRIKEAEEALQKSEYSLKMAQAIAHLGHWEWDMENEAMRWSDETYRILGYEPHALAPSRDTFFQLMHPDDREHVSTVITQAAGEQRGFDVEYRITLPDGKVRVVHGMGEVLHFGPDKPPKMIGTIRDVAADRPLEVLGVIQDITERKELESRLALEARTDSLTGCSNRRHFLLLANQELLRARRYGHDMSILMLDLDHFKQVNDRYGHHSGDLVLQKLVQVCRATLREEDVIGRLGGEEFAVLLPETGAAKALEVAERVRRAIADTEVRPDQGIALRFTTSVGVATLTQEDSAIEILLGRADGALYEAKDTGRNKVVASRTGVSK